MTEVMPRPLLSVTGLVKHFPVRKGLLQRAVGQVHAVDGISFDIAEGETLGLVGESGCGKSTAGKTILKLIDPTEGEIRISGKRIDGLSRGEMRPYRRQLQVVFQDPYSSLNPRLKIRDIIGEPLINYGVSGGRELEDRVEELALKVGLRAEALDRFPHEFSVGPLFRRPLHPYTKGLLHSVPRLGATLASEQALRLAEIPGTVPSLKEAIPGCPFQARCSFASDRCRYEMPQFEEKEPGHYAACFHSDRVALA